MKTLLTVSAFFEAPVGLLLLVVPGIVFPILMGAPLESSSAFVMARLAGAAILALAIACWQARDTGPAAASIAIAMLFYNVAATAVIGHASIRLGMSSVFLWPVMVLHSVLALWCAFTLWAVRNRAAKV